MVRPQPNQCLEVQGQAKVTQLADGGASLLPGVSELMLLQKRSRPRDPAGLSPVPALV